MVFDKYSQIVKSYAKINLSLKIIDKRGDGYHTLEMVMVPLELHDVIEIERRPGSLDTFITCDEVGIIDIHNNLCTKAVDAMRREFGFKDNFEISIHKEIPFSAGLGGGSSNAAAVIKCLIGMLRLKADPDVINRIALSLGADVPFFLSCKPSLVTGLGEKLQPISIKSTYYCLIVKPQKGLSTKNVFEASDAFEKENTNTEQILKALARDDLQTLGKVMGNDLYKPAISLLPEVKEVVEALSRAGFPVSAMTGSGSACFGLSKDLKFVKDNAKKFKSLGYVVRMTKTTN